MPLYEYKCEDCGKISEVLHKKVNPQEKPVCPSCGSKRLAKLISIPSVSVKSEASVAGGTCCGRRRCRCWTPLPVNVAFGGQREAPRLRIRCGVGGVPMQCDTYLAWGGVRAPMTGV